MVLFVLDLRFMTTFAPIIETVTFNFIVTFFFIFFLLLVFIILLALLVTSSLILIFDI